MKPLINGISDTQNTNDDSGVLNKRYTIQIEHLNHTFDIGTDHEYNIFQDFSLQVEKDENKSSIISVMGGSGCGKSCLLRVIAGLMKPHSGDVFINGKSQSEYNSLPMVFQSYSSYEWMTVIDNVALPLIVQGIEKGVARERAFEYLKLVGLESMATKYAKSSVLSGGQLQRVSIARCLASGSNVFLLDESTGALDIKMKQEIQDILLGICHNSNIETTIINVTHSVEEALYISDKIILLESNPCKVIGEIDVNYGQQNRGDWVFETNEYKDYYQYITTILNKSN